MNDFYKILENIYLKIMMSWEYFFKKFSQTTSNDYLILFYKKDLEMMEFNFNDFVTQLENYKNTLMS